MHHLFALCCCYPAEADSETGLIAVCPYIGSCLLGMGGPWHGCAVPTLPTLTYSLRRTVYKGQFREPIGLARYASSPWGNVCPVRLATLSYGDGMISATTAPYAFGFPELSL